MIVRDIQVEDALIQVHHANQLLAVGSPQPDRFHRLAPYDGIPDTLRRVRDRGRGPRLATESPDRRRGRKDTVGGTATRTPLTARSPASRSAARTLPGHRRVNRPRPRARSSDEALKAG